MQRNSGRIGALRFALISAVFLAGVIILSSCAAPAAPTPTAQPTAPPKPTTAVQPTAAAKATPAAQDASATKEVAGGNPQQGTQAIGRYGCGGCHIIPGVAGANGTSAPNLSGFASRDKIAGTANNTPDNLVKWIQDPQSIKSGTSMPNLGVTEPDARNIAAYLYTLK